MANFLADEEALYVGETARNLYTRVGEHINSKCGGSFMTKHMADKKLDFQLLYHLHFCKPFNCLYSPVVLQAIVVKTNTDCHIRQVREGVLTSKYGTNIIYY